MFVNNSYFDFFFRTSLPVFTCFLRSCINCR